MDCHVSIAFATRWMGFRAITTEDAFGLTRILKPDRKELFPDLWLQKEITIVG